MPKDGQGSFSSKHCHDNCWYYVHPKNGMASLDMSARCSGIVSHDIKCIAMVLVWHPILGNNCSLTRIPSAVKQ